MIQYGMADFHCDVLSKLLLDNTLEFTGNASAGLDVTYERLCAANACFQSFAIYIPASLGQQLRPILHSIDLFYQKIAALPGMLAIRTRGDLARARAEGKIGCLLTIEGVDGLQGDLAVLRLLVQLGVRAVGLTWNHANWAADGVMEPRQGGLTAKGKAAVQQCQASGIIIDVSHLTDTAFWDVAALSVKPCIASHSNVRLLCGHPRNLADDQIAHLIATNGRIGMTFVPWFVDDSPTGPSIDKLLAHIEHVCQLGGARHVMFGSDFDGIDRHMPGLANPVESWNLINRLLQAYPEHLVQGFVYGNALTFLEENLPE